MKKNKLSKRLLRILLPHWTILIAVAMALFIPTIVSFSAGCDIRITILTSLAIIVYFFIIVLFSLWRIEKRLSQSLRRK